jgi:hypothetical protein
MFERADESGSAAAAQQGPSNESHIVSKELYKRVKDYTLPDENTKVANLAISPSEDNLVCSLDNNQIFSIALSNAEVKVGCKCITQI